MNEVKIRVPVAFHRAINLAAARRGVPASALVAMAIHEYLYQRGELNAPSPVAANNVAPKPTPSFDMSAWLDDDEDDDT